MGIVFPTLIILSSIFSIQSTAQVTSPPPGFRCTNPATTCNSLIDYKLPNTTTLSAIATLFEIKNFRSLLGANNLPLTTPKTRQFNADQILKIPFPCLCHNGTGISNHRPIYTVVPDDSLYHIAAEVFSGLVLWPQIQSVNNISDVDVIFVGQKVWIPLPCSCDDVGGEAVVHYGYLATSGSTLSGIAQQFNTKVSTLLNLNGMSSPAQLLPDSILDVPLKVCNTKARSDSMDYPLLVPNGTYTYTANNCVRCKCNAANNWILNCEPSGINPRNGRTCPSTQCVGTNFELGNITSDSSCTLSRCAYNGYGNNTIYTTLYKESTCLEGSNSNNISPLGNGSKSMRWSFALGASMIALHILRWYL